MNSISSLVDGGSTIWDISKMFPVQILENSQKIPSDISDQKRWKFMKRKIFNEKDRKHAFEHDKE